LLLLLALFAVAACGGDDDDSSGNGLAAIDIVPSLAAEGFNQTEPETLPNTGELDIAFSVYERSSQPPVQARAEVRVYPADSDATDDFALQAQGWKNPPPNLFGRDPGNAEIDAVEGVDDAVAYLGANADGQGFRIWTDVYRIGRVVVVSHVLSQDEATVLPIRQRIAELVGEKARS